jgi:GH15 family glucan-1,4-alpha-glucosidase
MRAVRDDGFVPLGGYGFLSDGRAGALVAADGSVDWLAAPRMDSPPVFAKLLDPDEGGCFALAPTVDHETTQRYVPDTMLVETTFRCADSVVHVTDSLNRSTSGPLPWTELARRIHVVGDPVPMRWQVRPGSLLGTHRPWRHGHDHTPVMHVGSLMVAVVGDGAAAAPHPGGSSAAGEFTAGPDEDLLLAVVVSEAEPVPVPPAATIAARSEHTEAFWRHWCEKVHFDGPRRDEVRRSAMVLKGLTMTPEGGMLAALTTSLPEQIGGERNFDYRFTWVRDASFALDAMSGLRLSEEVHGTISWLLRAVRRTTPEVRPMYTVHGEPAPAEMSARARLRGYRGSSPVHVGNSAADQLQLGACGDLMDAVWRYTEDHGRLDQDSAETLATVADHVCDRWTDPDAGIWELSDMAHYTTSKIGCWVALDRAVRLVESGQMPSSRVDRWLCERDAVHAWTDRHCWSETKSSYTFHADTDELDAAVLLAARTHYLAGDDPRLASTISAIRTELAAGGPLLYRYTGMAGQEGAFAACSFWLVEALAATGQRDEACAVLDELLGYAGDTGLLTEEIDPSSGELLGNLPQGLSHLALIGAAMAVR